MWIDKETSVAGEQDNDVPELVVVARVGAPHGLRGMVRLEVRTDIPAERFAPGQVLDAGGHGELTVAASEERSGTWYVRFAEAPDRTAVETLRGTWLSAPAIAEAEGWYRHQLIGLPVEDTQGRHRGTISDLQHLPAQDVLEITEPQGSRSLVPFVADLVPVVEADRVVVDPPPGLLAEGGPDADAS